MYIYIYISYNVIYMDTYIYIYILCVHAAFNGGDAKCAGACRTSNKSTPPGSHRIFQTQLKNLFIYIYIDIYIYIYDTLFSMCP
jgi:hypothetical protein